MKQLVLATHNAHKAEEISALLADLSVQVLTLDSFPAIGAIAEDADTIEGNSLLKAETVFRAAGLPSLADDTGLEVYYLALAPGVRSSRYAGDQATYADNVAKLLKEMQGVPPRRRGARFRCVLTFLAPGTRPVSAEGLCRGTIVTEPRGTGGFGYDPVFLPIGGEKTFAELDPSAKNAFSHRGKATAAILPALRDYFK